MPGSTTSHSLPLIRWIVLLLAVTSVSACSGGDGSGTGPCAGTATFDCLAANQWGFDSIRTVPAWARVSRLDGREPGEGQTVGVIDSGIDRDHPTFAGKTVTEVFLGGATDETGDEYSHGTAVASVIAGRTAAAPGVAWGADIAMFVHPVPSSFSIPTALADLAREDGGFAATVNRVLDWSSGRRTLDFVNLSLGLPLVTIERYGAQDLRRVFGDSIAAFAQSARSRKTVFVFAAGNSHGEECDPAHYTGHSDLCESYVEDGRTAYRVNARSVGVYAGLPARIPELRGHTIAVAGIGRDGHIWEFSNRCGIAADWCISAPAEDIRAAYFGPHRDTVEPGIRDFFIESGTSWAAPMVTGALVVMKHYFRDQMSNTELVGRMMRTANKTGIYADSAIYGQGLLDLDAATTPVGGTRIALGNAVSGSGSPTARTRFIPGGALGNRPALSFAHQEVAAFDELGAPFWYTLGDFASTAPRALATARLDAFLAPESWRVDAGTPAGPADGETATRTVPLLLGGFVPAPDSDRWNGLRLGHLGASAAGLGSGHLALAGRAPAFDARGADGLGFTAFSTEGGHDRAPVWGALLTWQPDGAPFDLPLNLVGGWMAEGETMLGSRSAGAFGRLSSASALVGFEGGKQAGAWRLGASAELGLAHPRAGGGMLTRLSPLYSSAFAVRAERSLDENGSLRVSASQPLRVETGHARLSVPVGRTREGRVLRRSLTAGLAPKGRQIDLSVRWQKRLSSGGSLGLGAIWTLEPRHDAAASSELTLLAGWHRRF